MTKISGMVAASASTTKITEKSALTGRETLFNRDAPFGPRRG
jgi:hypothetical protein